jgi:putative transposase
MPDPFPTPGMESLTVPDWFLPFSPRWSDPERMTQSYRRKLPHWRYEGATYVVTFRLHDSLPRAVAVALHEEAAVWMRRIAAERAALNGLLSAATHLAWEAFQQEHFRHLDSHLDACHGSCLLRRPECRAIVAEALTFFEGERCRVGAFVIMPNHVHVLCSPLPGWPLEGIAGSWKQHSARRLNDLLGTRGRHWQPETHDRLVRDGDHFRRAVSYLAKNPAKARLPAGEATVWLAPELRGAEQ